MADETKPTRPYKSRGGQVPFVPEDNQRMMVQVLRANGIDIVHIARNIKHPDGRPITVPTLHKYFKEELANGYEQINASMGAVIVKAAMGGNWGAAKYWLLTRGHASWKITDQTLIGGLPGSEPIKVDGEARVVVYLPDNGRPMAAKVEDEDNGEPDEEEG